MLLVVERPVTSESTPDCAVLMPVEAEVDNAVTALFVGREAGRQRANVGIRRAQTRRERGEPLEAEVDRAVTLLFGVERPVDKEQPRCCWSSKAGQTAIHARLRRADPVEAEVDSTVTSLFVVEGRSTETQCSNSPCSAPSKARRQCH